MDAQKRKELMRNFKAYAIEAYRRGDVVARNQAAMNWRELATTAELKKAPKILKN